MLYIGCHLSTTDGFTAMGETALSIGANTFQFFSRNPRGSRSKAVNPKDVAGLCDILQKHGFGPLLAHAPYTLNPCSADPKVRDFAHMVLEEDLAMLEKYLPGQYYTFHPGSHVGQGEEEGIRLIVEALNTALKPGQTTWVLLEAMSGKGSEVGKSFEELHSIISQVEHAERLGVCLDTCHVYSAGYDIAADLDGVLEKFDKTVGLERLKAIHLNDSLTPFDSHKDRHAAIGQGSLGLEAVVGVINHPALRHLPFYLETPHELPGYAEEIAMLRGLYKG